MKKTTPNKKTSVKNAAKPVVAQPVVKKQNAQAENCKQCFNPWSLSVYVYWFIILFFIASTFYILGRSHNVLHTPANNVEITEEALMQGADYYNSGKEKLLSGNLEDAIADLTASIDTGTAGTDTYILRGEAYMQAANYRAAMEDFNTVVSKDPVNAVAYYDLALLNTRLEDYSAALNDINNALAAQVAHPTDVLQLRDLYAKRGQLNLWLKNWEGAVADYTNSLARPEGIVSPNVYAERAEAYTALGNYADAVADYSSAVRVISEQIQGAATSEERESLSSRAMNYFEKSAALNLSLGNKDAARSDLESANTIAGALNDQETMQRIQGLIANLNQMQ